MAKYVKLGPKASNFSDPYSRLNLAGPEIKRMNQKHQTSGKVKKAFQGGHLAVATKTEYDEWELINEKNLRNVSADPDIKLRRLQEQLAETKAENAKLVAELKSKKEPDVPTREDELHELNKADLVDLYKDTYELSDEDIEIFTKLTKDGMVEELLKLESETE